MRQRVVIALALCANPASWSSPTSRRPRSTFRSRPRSSPVLKRMCREHGTAVMLITHDMGVIAETADRVAVMYAGRWSRKARSPTSCAPPPPLRRRPDGLDPGRSASVPGPAAADQGLDAARRRGCRPAAPSRRAAPAARPLCRERSRPELREAGATRAACWHVPPALGGGGRRCLTTRPRRTNPRPLTRRRISRCTSAWRLPLVSRALGKGRKTCSRRSTA